MVLQIELDPLREARLIEDAYLLGVSPEELASSLLQKSIPMRVTGTSTFTPESLQRMLREMAKGSEELPVLPPEATDRESFYEDRL